MKILEWLRKLGILRFGAEGAVYTNAKDRPLSVQQHDIFDSQRDVWNSAAQPPTDSKEPELKAKPK